MNLSVIFIGLLVTMFILATYTDLRSHRIPNTISFVTAAAALLLHSWYGGFAAALLSLGGLLLGLLVFLPLYAARGMAAGDVKLMAAAGAVIGPKLVIVAAGASLLIGAIVALVIVLSRSTRMQTLSRYARIFTGTMLSMRPKYIRPEAGDAALTRFPFAVVIFAGSITALWWNGAFLKVGM